MFGHYAPEYNPKVHGPYNPGTYYGPKDTPFGEVKLGDLGAWLSRRSFHPTAIVQCMARAAWRYNVKWVNVKRPRYVYYMQASLIASAVCAVMLWPRYLKYHRHSKYH